MTSARRTSPGRVTIRPRSQDRRTSSERLRTTSPGRRNRRARAPGATRGMRPPGGPPRRPRRRRRRCLDRGGRRRPIDRDWSFRRRLDIGSSQERRAPWPLRSPIPPAAQRPCSRRARPQRRRSRRRSGSAGASRATGARAGPSRRPVLPAGALPAPGPVTVTEVGMFGTVVLCDHLFFPGALAATTWSPGSTGSASPHEARPMTTPSRSTINPSTGELTSMANRTRFGSSAAARARATCSRCDWPAALVAAATSRKRPHALAVRPRCSRQSARLKLVPIPGSNRKLASNLGQASA